MAVGLFKSGQFLDVDFDHQFIPTEKHDATYSYKKAFGYFPGVASVGGVIVHVENRDGNTPVKFCQAETFKTWAVHLPIPCRLRLLFERNRGNHRRAQQSVLSACVKLRERLTEFAELDLPLKSITRNARCAASSSTGSWKRKAIASSFSARALSMSRTSSVTLSATSIDAY
jgi:hypothetical protein